MGMPGESYLRDPCCPSCKEPLHGLATRCWAGGEGCGWVKGKDEPGPEDGTTDGTKRKPKLAPNTDDPEPRYLVIQWASLASVNKRSGGMVGWTSKEYRNAMAAARDDVTAQVLTNGWSPLSGPLRVQLDYYPPDNRRRDYHNLDKLVLDAMEAKDDHPGLYLDDAQVWDWHGSKREKEADARVVIKVQAITSHELEWHKEAA